MSQMPIEANVVLTADNSQFDASMQTSAGNTDAVAASIDILGKKLNDISKSAGRKLLGFSAADTAAVTAGTAAYAAFERQMTSLSAQAAVLNRDMESQQRAMTGYVSNVNKLRDTFGTSTSEAAALVKNITALSDQTAPVNQLASTFTKLGAATQESAVALQGSMSQFQRSMGVPQRDTQRLANQLTVLSANSGQSASAILSFSQQLAPIGRSVGMTATDIMGISTAFNKVGQDGFQAATGFTTMMTDIAKATQSGSPELAKYANLVGMTVNQFKELGGTDQYLKIFEALNRQGPQAITTLNRMGYDGIRMQRSIQALAQAGGPGQEINMARNADPNAMNRGATAALSGITDNLKRLRSELAMTAEAFGSTFAGPAKMFIGVVTEIAQAGRMLMESPIGKLASWALGLAAPIAAAAGAVALMGKSLLGLSGAMMFLGGSQTRGFLEGRRGFGPLGSDTMGPQGARIDEKGNFIQRALYTGGQRVGTRFNDPTRDYDATRNRYNEWLYRNTGGRLGSPPPPPGMFSRTMGMGMSGIGWTARNLIGAQFSPLYGGVRGMPGAFGKNALDDVTQRDRIFNRARLSDYTGPASAMLYGMGARMGDRDLPWWKRLTAGPTPDAVPSEAMAAYTKAGTVDLSSNEAVRTAIARGTAGPTPEDTKQAILKGGDEYQKAQEKLTKASTGTAEAMEKTTKSVTGAGAGFKNMMSGIFGVSGLAGSMGSAGMGAGRMAGRGLAMGGRALLSGGLNLFGGPLGLGLMAGIGGYAAWRGMRDDTTMKISDQSGVLDPYYTAAGVSGPIAYNPQYQSQRNVASSATAMRVSPTDISAATSPGYQPTNPDFKGLTSDQAMARIAPGFADLRSNPAALNALKLDLTSEYGADVATRMMGQLDRGEAGGVEPLFRSAMTMGLSQESTGNRFSRLTGAYRDTRDFTAMTSPETASGLRGQQLGEALTMYSEFAGSNLNPRVVQDLTGAVTTFDKYGQQRQGFGRAMAKDIFGVDLDEEQARALRFGTGTEEEQIKYFIERNITGPQAVFNQEQRQQALGNVGKDSLLMGSEALAAIIKGLGGEGEVFAGPSLEDRITDIPGMGQSFRGVAVQQALKHEEDVNAQLVGAQTWVSSLQDRGKSFPQINKILGNAMAEAGNVDDKAYQLAETAQGLAQQQQQFQMAGASRTERFGADVAKFKSDIEIAAGDPREKEKINAAKQAMFASAEEQRTYFQSLLLQQREFDVSKRRGEEDFALQRERQDYEYNLQRDRAQQDYHTQRMWQEQDYKRARERSEFEYNLQRDHAVEDHNRSQHRAMENFDRSRRRQEVDFHHQVMLMVEQTAMSAANIYERTAVQRTSSAGWLLFNADEQLEDLEGQAQNLRRVRRMGLTDNAIQQLDLTNPKNAQQLARMVTDLANDPQMVRQFNKAVSERLKVARDLTTDESSIMWQEHTRQHRLSRRRAMNDFDRDLRQGQDDFERSLDRMDDAFRRSMRQQEEDHERVMDRGATQFGLSMDRMADDYDRTTDQMVDDFEKSMNRAAQDLNRMAKSIDGNLKEMLTKSLKHLSGHAREQAKTVMEEIRGLKGDASGVSIELMQAMADIFGVKYTPPRRFGANARGGAVDGGHPGSDSPTYSGGGGAAAGGVLPGRSIGRDDMHFFSPQHGRLSLAGGEAIMVPEWVDAVGGPEAVKAMNSKARKGYAMGGVTPASGDWNQHPGYPWARWAGDINVPGDETGNPVRAWKSGKVAFRGFIGSAADPSYGNTIKINHPSSSEETLYAHLSRMLVQVGQMVQAGAKIGEVGSTGNASGPHLHFEIKGGTGPIDTSGTSGPAGEMSLNSILRDEYPRVERAVDDMSQVRPLGRGQMSKIINRMARKAADKMRNKARRQGVDLSELGMGSVPANPRGNVAMGREMAENFGWTGNQWAALYNLWMGESGWRTNADNPTSPAYGIPQAYTTAHDMPPGYFTNPEVQIRWGLNYIKDRYGTPARALSLWNSRSPHWYGDGAILAKNGAQTIGVGERGNEIVLPLDRKGVDFLAALMQRTQPGLEARNTNTHAHSQPVLTHQVHQYNIDRSTSFTGPITVQASDPNQFITQLRNRERARALTKPVGGSRVA